jgi:hypothetical protein
MKKVLVLMLVLGMAAFANATVIDVVKVGMGSLGNAGTSTDPLDIGETITVKLVMNFNPTTAGLPTGARAGYLLSSLNVSLSVSGGGTLGPTSTSYGDPVWEKSTRWSLFGIVDSDEDYTNGFEKIGAAANPAIYPLTAGATTDLMWDLVITCTGPGPVTIDLGIAGPSDYAPWRGPNNNTDPLPAWQAMTNDDLGDLIIHQVPEPMTIALLGLGGLLLRRRR